METQVRTPQGVFNQPQRLMVPLFQRPYVWSLESQWQPLWADVVRVAERLLKRPADKQQPHFLGAVVLQQVQKSTGHLQERIIIDGQQRLTTLQLLMDALHGALKAAGAVVSALRLEALVENQAAYCRAPEDRFKVWPTNRDRPAFNAVMSADALVDYDKLGNAGERMVLAHRYFYKQAADWLSAEGPEHLEARATAVETCIRDYLQLVVIDLAVDENAQEIFETLNARGAQLTAADLVKNFVFQRLSESKQDVEVLYARYWKELETPFWETEVQVGRLKFPRSSIFLNHWLVAQTGQEVLTREVFHRFKRFADDSGVPMATLLERMHRASGVYRSFLDSTTTPGSQVTRLGLFGYRTGVLESEVVKPLILALQDPELPAIPQEQFEKALEAIESWMVRRMLVRATTKNYNMIVAELIGKLGGESRARAGDVIQDFFASQSSDSSYWPDDAEVRQELALLQVYRRIRRARPSDAARDAGGLSPRLGGRQDRSWWRTCSARTSRD